MCGWCDVIVLHVLRVRVLRGLMIELVPALCLPPNAAVW